MLVTLSQSGSGATVGLCKQKATSPQPEALAEFRRSIRLAPQAQTGIFIVRLELAFSYGACGAAELSELRFSGRSFRSSLPEM